VPAILERDGDPWASILSSKQDLDTLLERQSA
jgi:hypothetical protein